MSDEIVMLRGLVGELREDLAGYRADLREFAARTQGSLDTLAATKHGEHQRLEDWIGHVEHRGKKTETAGHAIHDRVDRLEGPDGRLATLERRFDRLVWVGAGVGLGAGTLGGAASALLTRAVGDGSLGDGALGADLVRLAVTVLRQGMGA